MSKSQISIEYLILVGFVLGVVIIPAMYFLRGLAGESVYETVNAKKVNDAGNELVKNAKEMYYLGLYSKQIVEHNMPKNLERMFIVELDDGTETYYYLVFHLDTNKYFFQSDIPLMAEVSMPGVDLITDILITETLIPECAAAACKIYDYNVLLEGKRKFLIETRLDSGVAKASVSPIK